MVVATRFRYERRSVFQLLLLAWCSAFFVGLTNADDGIEIAIPGQYVEAESVTSGGGWWGIYRNGTAFTLEATSLAVSAIPSVFQAPDEEPSGVSIRASEDRSCVAVVRGAKSFRAGLLVTRRSPETSRPFLYPGEKRDLTLGSEVTGTHFHILAIGTAIVPVGSPTVGFRDYALVLFQGSDRDGVRQTLLTYETVSVFEKPEIIWAGDLDRDGKPDVIVNQTVGESETCVALYLSTAAADGELVGLVAQWRALGPC